MADDPLDGACAQVGRFLYHFANLEEEINQALTKLLKLSPVAADWIIHNVSFARRFNFVYVVALDQIKDRKGHSQVKKILGKVIQHNEDRNLMAHSRFEPTNNGVKFIPVRNSAKKTTSWSKGKFKAQCKAMDDLVNQLKGEVVARVRPAKKSYIETYVMTADPYQPMRRLEVAFDQAHGTPGLRKTHAKDS